MSLQSLTEEAIEKTGISHTDAVTIHHQIQDILQDPSTRNVNGSLHLWHRITVSILHPNHPPALHKLLFDATYSHWNHAIYGPPPCWIPTPQSIAQTNAAKFMASHFHHQSNSNTTTTSSSSDWPAFQRYSYHQPESFWPTLLSQALHINFHTPPSRILDFKNDNINASFSSSPPDADAARWLPGARLNIAECALRTTTTTTTTTTTNNPHPFSPAIIWATEYSPTTLHTISRASLSHQAHTISTSLLTTMALRPGDAVGIIMPMTPECVAIYLGIILAGCVVVSIADSFSPVEMEARLRIGNAVVVFTQDVVKRGKKGLPLLPRVQKACDHLERTHKKKRPRIVVVMQRDYYYYYDYDDDRGREERRGENNNNSNTTTSSMMHPQDMTWDSFLNNNNNYYNNNNNNHNTAIPSVSTKCHSADAYDTTNILFSSGTTGEPKAIPWTHITPIRCATDAFFHQDIRPGDVLCWPTSIGWMMGPWLVYASLMNGAAMALFQGAPTGREFGRFVEAAGVTCLGLVPSIVSAWRGVSANSNNNSNTSSSGGSCMDGLCWDSIRTFSSTGEASSPEDYFWLSGRVKGYCPIIEYCGGTEIGGAYMSGTALLPCSPSVFNTPCIASCPVIIMRENNNKRGGEVEMSPHGEDSSPVTGEVSLAAPMLGISQRLLNRDHKKLYYDGMPSSGGKSKGRWYVLRRHGDEMERLPGWGGMRYRARGRVDDAMNLGGIKVGSVELEQAVMEGLGEARVVEVAAVGVPSGGGRGGRGGPEKLVLFLVLTEKGGGQDGEKMDMLLMECRKVVAGRLNPLFRVEKVVLMKSLPRTSSGKVLRRTLREQEIGMQRGGSRSRM